MDKIIYRLRKVVFFIATLLCVGYTYINSVLPSKEELDDGLRVYPYYQDTYYIPISSNSGTTSLNGMSNVYFNMSNAGFNVYNENITSEYIDVSFVNNEGEAYRFYYDTKTSVITFFYSDYEKSSMGLTYIIEMKGRER